MRIRSVKPEFWVHPIMSKQPDPVRLMALGILNYADDEGYFMADPILVRNHLRPFDESSTNTRELLDALIELGYIELSESKNHGTIGRVVNFLKHQRIDRPSASKIKAYFDSSSIRRGLDEPSPPEGIREQGEDQGSNVLFGLEEKHQTKPEWAPSPLMLRINSWFKRRTTTKWSKDEIKSLKAIGTPTDDDLADLERYYTAKHPPEKDYRRRDILTLLNNWNGEIDRARRFKPNTGF